MRTLFALILIASGCTQDNPLLTASGPDFGGAGDGAQAGDGGPGPGAMDGGAADADGGSEGPHYTSCAEVAAALPGAVDGDFTLYYKGKPWTAYCRNMPGSPAVGTPAEYLTLPNGAAANVSEYATTMTGTARTAYSRVRIDPVALQVLPADETYATSSGVAIPCGATGSTVTDLPYGFATACEGDKVTAHGMIDLRGTPFVVAPGAFVLSGQSPKGDAVYSAGGQVAALNASGFPGTLSPKAARVSLVYP